MFYLTLINETDHVIELCEEHEIAETAIPRKIAYELTSELNNRDTGKVWRAIYDTQPFEWPVEPS